MLHATAPPRKGRGTRKTVCPTDKTPAELKDAVIAMATRRMTMKALSKLIGISEAAVGQWLRGTKPIKPRDAYAIRYVLQHCYWDDITSDWVVID